MFITITRGTLRRIAAGAAVFALVMALFMLLPQRQTAETAAASGNWGLSFQVEGEPPEGNVSAGQLRQWDAYYLGDTAQKTIYLTFDAGYENGFTSAILDALKKRRNGYAVFRSHARRGRYSIQQSRAVVFGVCWNWITENRLSHSVSAACAVGFRQEQRCSPIYTCQTSFEAAYIKAKENRCVSPA